MAVRTESARLQVVIACAVLLLGAVTAAWLGDPALNSGSDAGGKTATVVSMAEAGLEGADLGYWAAEVDTAGVFHPIIKTANTSAGWIQVTSAVMPAASALGSRAGGSLGALWLSLLAVPVGALAARHLSRTLGSASGWPAFWVIGAGSPLGFYGLDQWEHAPAMAAALWAVALLLARPVGPQVVLLGIATAAAVTLRRETAFVLLAVLVLEALRPMARRHWLSQWRSVVLAGPVTLAVLAAAQFFDQRALGSTTADRSLSQAQIAGSDLGQRLDDALLTTISLFPSTDLPSLLVSVLPLLGLALAAAGTVRDEDSWRRVGLALAVVGLGARIARDGLGFVPGAIAVLPVIAVAPVLARRANRGLLLACGVAIVGVLAFQWTGSLAAQWGGRYLLVPAAVMAIVAVVELEAIGLRRPVAVVALGATAAMATLGFVFHIDRTDALASSRDDILAVTGGDVVISTHGHFGREIGATVVAERWLLADQLDEVDDAFLVAGTAAIDETIWLLHPGTCAAPCERRWGDRDDADVPAGWQAGEVVPVEWLDGTYVVEAFTPVGVAREVDR